MKINRKTIEIYLILGTDFGKKIFQNIFLIFLTFIDENRGDEGYWRIKPMSFFTIAFQQFASLFVNRALFDDLPINTHLFSTLQENINNRQITNLHHTK